MVVERELAKTNRRRTDMSREEFTALVWEQKQKSGDTIIDQLKRLGASCDWSPQRLHHVRRPERARGRRGQFPRCRHQGLRGDVQSQGQGRKPGPLIYRGKRLVNWDPHFETAISDLEVEQIEVQGQMWHFKYPLAGGETYEYVEKDEDGNVTLRETRDYISIATTRPETMLGDGAVAVHPSDERYAPIVGKLCEIPVGPKEHRRLIPIITDEYPDPTFGSGAVKITGAHDFNDYGVAKRNDIPCYRLMDTKAAMRADGAPYEEAAAIAMEVAKGKRTLTEAETDALNLVPDDLRGLDRYEARKRVIDQITSRGWPSPSSTKSIDKETGAEHLERIPLGRTEQDDAAAWRPLEGGHRADADRPVVRRHRQDRRARRWRPSATAWRRRRPAPSTKRPATPASCPNATPRPISTGWRTSSPGASPASSGGGTRSRCGMRLCQRNPDGVRESGAQVPQTHGAVQAGRFRV